MTVVTPKLEICARLRELAERCEQATGPDRELDGSIWWATLTHEQVEEVDRSGFIRECIDRDGSAGKALAAFYDSSNPACLAKIAFQRPFTASLDAAMSLVPESEDNVFHLFNHRSGHWEVDLGAHAATCFRGMGQTPALALCGAALRARSATARQAGSEPPLSPYPETGSEGGE